MAGGGRAARRKPGGIRWPLWGNPALERRCRVDHRRNAERSFGRGRVRARSRSPGHGPAAVARSPNFTRHFARSGGLGPDLQEGPCLASARPGDAVCRLRSYARQAKRLTEERACCALCRRRTLTEMNVRLDTVISDITGATGQRILCTIVDGERDPRRLAALRNGTDEGRLITQRHHRAFR